MNPVVLTREIIEKEKSKGLTYEDIAAKYGTSRRTVGRILSKAIKKEVLEDKEPVKEVTEKEGKRYLLSEMSGNEKAVRYIYNDKLDQYVTFLRCVPEPILVSGVQHRAMAAAYSNWDGNPASVNQICRQFSMPRPWFMEYKTIHGWTHDREPFSAEEVFDTPVDDLTEVAFQRKRQALAEKFETRRWLEVQKAADKWNDFEHSVIKPLEELIAINAPAYTLPLLELRESEKRYALVLNPMDLHFGKNSWTDLWGQTYNKQETERLLTFHTEDILELIAPYGRPEVILVSVGSDWFHVDNFSGTTTAGTPQDMDGLPGHMMFEGCMLAVKHIDMLRQIAPVNLIFVPGNHDKQNSFSIMHFLFAWYRNCEDVEVNIATQHRQYVQYGNSLIGFMHGDENKPSELGPLMASEASEAWALCRFRYFFSGHLHHETSRDVNGVRHFQLPSLAPADAWHDKKGYVLSQRSLHAHMITLDLGKRVTFESPVREDFVKRPIISGIKLRHLSR